jgi:hypothetical protein
LSKKDDNSKGTPKAVSKGQEEGKRGRKKKEGAVSWNRPNYKNKSTKTITGAIKFPYLSSYNPGSPMKSQGISNQPTYKSRS